MKSKISFSIIICLIWNLGIQAQKTINAVFVEEKISIDALFDEQAWINNNEIATDFIATQPQPNLPVDHPTEVKLLYDNEALYISAFMKDAARDSIMQELSLRDDIGNTDYFGILIDTYGNGTSVFEFVVTATGVQVDTKISTTNWERSWDAVWFSKAKVADNGWYVEMKIPFAALRFPNTDVQKWKANFFRRRQLSGKLDCWQNVDFERNNAWLTEMGHLEGIENVKTPVRLSLSPYATVYGIHSKDSNRDPKTSLGSSYNMGMDIKYGINDAYTLDMTLVPDFGQVRSDDEVLNLSPFEVRFSENRAFFTEGTDLFEKAGVFYSRRVGNNQQLYNATKVSGRGKNGLGIGVFNAVAAEESEEIYNDSNGETKKEVIKPLTNYNVVVADKNLKNNSSITLTNTNVMRKGGSFHNANVTAGTFDLKDKEQLYGINGQLAISQLYFKSDDSQIGHDLRLNFHKLKGAFVYGIGYNETSADYDHNDLGFFTRGNQRQFYAYMTKRDFDGFWKFNRFNFWTNFNYFRNIDPNMHTQTVFNVGMYAQTKSFFQFNAWGNIAGKTNDFYETRVSGRHFTIAGRATFGYWMSTDQRKKIQFQSYGNMANFYDDDNQSSSNLGLTVRYRISNKLNASVDLSVSNQRNQKGYVNQEGDDSIIFGNRDIRTVNNYFNVNYILNNKMGFDIRVRHYWSTASYDAFYLLNTDGSLSSSEYNNFHNLNFNAFTIDATYKWRFAPGSEIAIVWKNNISGALTDPLLEYSDINYKDGFSTLSKLPQQNSLSLRVSYYLDYSTNIRPIFK